MFKRFESVTPRKANFKTREEWLTEFVDFMRPVFEDAGKPLSKVRVACGMTTSRNADGECFHSECSEDGTREIFISPTQSDPVAVCHILIHELCHAALPEDVTHGPEFKKLATTMGLEGRMTSTTPCEELRKALEDFIPKYLGEYPHKKMTRIKQNKQTTRLIKLTCEGCGMVIRTTRKWIDDTGAPTCACGGGFEEEE